MRCFNLQIGLAALSIVCSLKTECETFEILLLRVYPEWVLRGLPQKYPALLQRFASLLGDLFG